MPGWDYERAAAAEGSRSVCGCDEAGVGPLAGRVYAAAVILPDGLELPWLNDSKQVTEKRREVLFDQIRERAAAWSVTWVEPGEIDKIDILNSRIKAMQLAIDALEPKSDYALVDGNRDHGSKCAITVDHKLIVKGDSLSYSIAAASVLAKVSRDRYPQTLQERYKLTELDGKQGWELLEQGARKRGMLISGGEADTERMAKVLLDEFRGGKLGRFTLEEPEDIKA